MRKTKTLLTAATFALASCTSDTPERVTGPTALADVLGTILQLDGPAGPGAFVTTGGADVTFTTGELEERFSYTAKTHANGAVEGQFVIQVHVLGERINLLGTIPCYSIDPVTRIARVVGVVERTARPDLIPEGSSFQWSSQDNGEGPSSSPDRQSGLVDGGCPTTPHSDASLTPIDQGNIQVHPAASSR